MRSPYRVETAEEKASKAKKVEVLVRQTVQLIDKANDIVNSTNFIKYKKEYERITFDLLDMIIKTKYADPVEDAHFLRMTLSRIEAARMVIKSVEMDSKRIKPNE